MFTGDWFKSYVVQILPLIAFVIYMWGFAYYVAFYYEFGINIVNYISLNEVFVSALVPIVGAFTLVLTSMSFQYLIDCCGAGVLNNVSWKNKRRIAGCKKSLKAFNDKLGESHYRSHLHKLHSVAFLLVCIVFGCTFVYCTLSIEPKIKLGIALLLLGVFIGCINEYRLTLTNVKSSIVRRAVPRDIGIVILAIVIASFCIGANNAIEFKDSDNEREYTVKLIDGRVVTSDDMAYVGETYSAVFLYDRAGDKTVVINKEAISSIEFGTTKSLVKVIDGFMSDAGVGE